MQEKALQTKSAQTLRKQARSQRRSLTKLQQRLASKRCYEILKKNSDFIKAKHIAFYYAVDGELDIALLITLAQSLKKQCYLPSISHNSKKLTFYKMNRSERLCKQYFNIPEPKKRKSIYIKNIDLVFMPLLAFDLAGNRLGMGGGYYDFSFRHLAGKNYARTTKLIGVAHKCQEVEAIDAQDWDIKPNRIFAF